MSNYTNESKNKECLDPDYVSSDTVHFGIELELMIHDPDANKEEHDDEACARARIDRYDNMSILRDFLGVSRATAEAIYEYFDFDRYREQLVSDELQRECEDPSCHFRRRTIREILEEELIMLTNNNSVKVVSDASINKSVNESDIEVCWNYYASPETLQDNKKILDFLKNEQARFDTSCGLHINVNDYMKLATCVRDIPTSALEFLFNFVAPSRRSSSYCNKYAISCGNKYSMIYQQNDRLEFRFFSPTLDAKKLNAYVSLAHHIYRRLAGIARPMPKRLEAFLRKKMKEVNKLDDRVIEDTIEKTNNIKPLSELIKEYGKKDTAQAA